MNTFRRFPYFYGRKPEKIMPTPSTSSSSSSDMRGFIKLDMGRNAHLLAGEFWEAPRESPPTTSSFRIMVFT